jgi:hypothetical protein
MCARSRVSLPARRLHATGAVSTCMHVVRLSHACMYEHMHAYTDARAETKNIHARIHVLRVLRVERKQARSMPHTEYKTAGQH